MQLDYSADLMAIVAAKRAELEDAERRFSDDCLRRSDLKEGDIVQNRNGLRYKVKSIHFYTFHNRLHVSLYVRRQYKSGKLAWGHSSLTADEVDKVTDAT